MVSVLLISHFKNLFIYQDRPVKLTFAYRIEISFKDRLKFNDWMKNKRLMMAG
jgi:hypothetical protein